MTDEEYKEIANEQKRIEISLKSLEVNFEVNPNGDLKINKEFLKKIGESNVLTLFEEAPKISLDLIGVNKKSSLKMVLKSSEWDLMNPLDSGTCIKDSNNKLFGLSKIRAKDNEKEIWLSYEQVEYAPYILAPIGNLFMLNQDTISEILNSKISLEFQSLVQYEGDIEVKVNPEDDYE